MKKEANNLKKEDVSVGDRIEDTSSWKQGKATVTEITEKGFKYKLDQRFDFGARYGWTVEGECYLVGMTPLDTKYLERVCGWKKVNI
jgi:hypothetical protein